MSYHRHDPYYPCHACKTVMVGIIAPTPENVYEREVAREVCYECEQLAKHGEVAA